MKNTPNSSYSYCEQTIKVSHNLRRQHMISETNFNLMIKFVLWILLHFCQLFFFQLFVCDVLECWFNWSYYQFNLSMSIYLFCVRILDQKEWVGLKLNRGLPFREFNRWNIWLINFQKIGRAGAMVEIHSFPFQWLFTVSSLLIWTNTSNHFQVHLYLF